VTKLVALNNRIHQGVYIDANKAEEQIADLHMLPVVLSEFQKLVVQLPILFSKNSDTGQFVCVTLMGLQEGENLYWQDAAFQGFYTPLNVARQPFFVGQDEQSGDNYVICIDMDNPAVAQTSSANHDQVLFDVDGKASDYLLKAQDFLGRLIEGEQQTANFIQQLLKFKLLVPLALDITFENKQSSKIAGLYSIDEDKLQALSGEQLAGLNQQGFLAAAYTQLVSLGQIYTLIDRKNKRMAKPNPWFKASSE
jgi:hypothetical protein